MIIKATTLTALLITLFLTGCDRTPDWEQRSLDHWNSRDAANYYTILRTLECDPRIDGDAREVHCRIDVRMDTDYTDVIAERGSVTEDPVVAELIQRFGRFETGDERTVAIITRFEQVDGDWEVVPR